MAANEKKKYNVGKTLIMVLIVAVIAALAVYLIVFWFPKANEKQTETKKPAATEAATEFKITPCDAEDEKLFIESLPGVWSSYTKDGEPYTYTFDKDGGVRYKKDGENAIDYTYTFEDGLLTIKNDDKAFVYQCSKDAVGMMANMQYGEWKTVYSKTAEEIPDFNGCVYITGDFMYLGTVCLCRDDRLSGFDDKSLEGDWLGVSGDTVHFASDGTYTYVNSGVKNPGKYAVDFDRQILTLVVNGNSADYGKDQWGLDGRVLHIDKQYYFKASD